MTLTTPTTPTTINPFVGPVPFTREDPLYGREQELPRLFDLLLAQRIVLLYSPSGAGKTSLIEAKNGLRSLLVEQGFTVWPTIRVNRLPAASATPDKMPNRYLSSMLHSLAPGDAGNGHVAGAAWYATALPAAIADQSEGDDDRLDVLIFDQFEELLTADPADKTEKLAFLRQLGDLLAPRNRWALFAMREDYIAGLDPFLRLIPTQLSTTYRLDLLDPESAKRAIQHPAADHGVEFATDAATELVRNLRMMRVQRPDGIAESREGAWVEPVHLQIVCQGLWQDLVVTHHRRHIDLAHVVQPDAPAGAGTGDVVDQKLRTYYEDALQLTVGDEAVRAAGIDEGALRSWFDTGLITEQDVRPQLLLGDGRVGDLPVAAVWPLVDKRLVRKEDRRGLIWFELAHDRLIRPIRQSNTAWFRDHPSPLQTLRQQALLWSQHGEPDDLLLAGSALHDARQVEIKQADRLLPIEHRFLAESTLHLERRRARARRLKVGAGALIAVALLVSAFALLAIRSEREAEQQRKRAEQERNKAEVLAVVAQSQRQRLGGQDERAALLAREAYLRAHQNEGTDDGGAVSALRSALGGPRFGLVFRDHRSEVLAVTFRGEDQELVSVDRDGVIQRRSLHPPVPGEPTELCRPRDSQNSPCAATTIKIATFSGSGDSIALGLDSGVVLLADLDADDPQPVQLCELDAAISAIAFSADERTLAVADATGAVYLARIGAAPSCEPHIFFHSEGTSVNALAFDPVRGTLAIGTTSRLVWTDDLAHRLNPWARGDPRLSGEFGNTRVKSLAYSADGRYLAAGLQPAMVLLWDLNDPTSEPRTAFGEQGFISTLAFSPDGTHLATGGFDGTVLLRSTEVTAWSKLPVAITQGNLSVVEGVTFSQDGRFVSSGSLDQSVRLWDLEPPGLIDLHGETRKIRAVAIDPRSEDVPVIATGSDHGAIRIWNGNGDPTELCGHAECGDPADYALSVAYSSDGRILATVDGSKCVRLWDTSAINQLLTTMCTPRSAVLRAVAFDSTGRYVVAGGNSVWVWDRENPALPERLEPPHKLRLEQVWGVVFSPEGDRVFAVGALTKGVLKDRNVGFLYVWIRSNPGDAPWTPDGYSTTVWEQLAMIQGLAIHTERGLLAVGDWRGNVHLWRLDALDETPTTLATGGREVLAVAFDPTGHTLAIAGGDNVIRLWDVDQPLSVPETVSGFRDSLWSIAFSRDGRWLVGGGDDAIVHLWLMDAEALADRVCGSASRNLSIAEWSQYFPGEDYKRTCPNLPPGNGAADAP